MERFPDEFISWHHSTPVGIKVDEVFGMDSKSGRVWIELAKQIFCEQGQNYRQLLHFENGAPYIEGVDARISLTHTNHFLAVARLPKTPDTNLSQFNPRSCMGIDAEPKDRVQVLKLREKFLSERELEEIPKDDLNSTILAWTVKEATYKAGMTSGIDFKKDIIIDKLPVIDKDPEKMNRPQLGSVIFNFPKDLNMQPQQLALYSYESYGCIITLAFSPKCAKFGGKG